MEKSVDKEMLQDGLPAPKYAQEHPGQVYSDHLPVLLKPQSSKIPGILSWNVSTHDIKGLGLPTQKFYQENHYQQKKRCHRIFKALSYFGYPDFIALQGVSQELFKIMKDDCESSGSVLSYKIVWQESSANSKVGCATLYLSESYSLVNETRSSADPKSQLQRQSCKFKSKSGDKEFVIHNVCYTSEQSTSSLKSEIEAVFDSEDYKNSNNFIVGDFGCNILQIQSHKNIENLTTSVHFVPTEKGVSQISRSTDGGFYRLAGIEISEDANSTAILPLERMILNPSTGVVPKQPSVAKGFFEPTLSFTPLQEEIREALGKVRHGLERCELPLIDKISVELALNPLCRDRKFALTIPQNIFTLLKLSETLEGGKFKPSRDGGSYIGIYDSEQEVISYLNNIQVQKLEYRQGVLFKNNIISSFVILGVISAATVLFLELSGTTAITTNLWMFPHSEYQFVAAQDVILVVGAVLTLAIISTVIGFASKYIDSRGNDGNEILKKGDGKGDSKFLRK